MAKYLLVYHGAGRQVSKEDHEKAMAAWGAWFGSMGKALINAGSPVGKSWTVNGSGVTKDGGANPVSGYSLIEARDYDGAAAMAKGCPLLAGGGSVEIAEVMDM